MMTDQMLNAVKRHVASMIGQQGQSRIGTITSVNTDNHTARVMIQPEEVLSGWLPVATAMVGGGWGVVSPPSVGEQVIITPQEGDAEHGVITGRIFSLDQMPPKTYTDQYNKGVTTSVQPGEVGLVHETGTFIRLLGDRVLIHGDLFVDGNIRSTGNITSDMNIYAAIIIHAVSDILSDANIRAKVDVSAANNVVDAHGWLDRLRNNYDHHVHGLGSAGFPVPQDPE